MTSCGGVADFVLRGSFPSSRRSAPAPMASLGRGVQELVAGGSSAGEPAGLLLGGDRASCGLLWMMGGRIWLGSPSAMLAVDGERGSGSWRSWGAAPVDGRPLKAFSTATPTKAMARRGLFSSRWSLSSSAAVAAGVEVDSWWFAKDLGTWM